MSMFRFALLVVCLVAPILLAQAPAAEPPAPEVPLSEMRTPEMERETGEGDAEAERRLSIFSQQAVRAPRLSPRAETISGALNLEASNGVVLEAFSSTPNVFMRIGTGDSTSAFSVTNANSLSLFNVRGDGYTILRRDQDGITGFEINNANAGTAAVSASSQLRFFAGGVQTAKIASVGSGSTSATGGAGALQVWNVANGSIVFATNDTERMRIHADGSVAVGSTSNTARLNVVGSTGAKPALYAMQSTNVPANTSQNDWGLIAIAGNTVPAGVTNSSGVTGIQSQGWNYGPGAVGYASGGVFIGGNYYDRIGHVSNARGILVAVERGLGTVTNGYGVYMSDIEATNDYGVYQAAADDTNYFAGNVVIGGPPTTANTYVLAVQGNANFNGTVTGNSIQAHYQDVAEWVPSTTDLAPGTVVILNRDRDNEVMASATAYDTTVAGVVSAQPGLSLGVAGEGKEQVATTGRVKVRVDARTKPIRVGDLLVTSDTPGTAMRSEPMNISGRPFHQPGTIIGKALQPLDSGIGEILVLLSMQ